MKFLFFEIKRTPRPTSNKLVNAVSTIFEPERNEIWTAIGKLREDLTTTNRLAQATQRQLYRKIGPDTPDDESTVIPGAVPAKNQARTWRTGDPVS